MRYLFGGLIAWTILISPALGQGKPWVRNTPAKWAWSQIVHGKVADFNDRCGPPIFPDGEDASCREINSIAIEKMLTDHVLTDKIPHQGINLKHAIVIGEFDLSNLDVTRSVSITYSHIKAPLIASRSRFHSILDLSDSKLDDDLQVSGTQLDQDLKLEDAKINGVVNLIGATISGYAHFKGLRASYLIMNGSHIGKDLILDQLKFRDTKNPPDSPPCRLGYRYRVCAFDIDVSGQLGMRDLSVDDSTFDLRDGKIGSDFWVSGSINGIYLNGARIGGTLYLRPGHIDTLDLTETQIGRELQIKTHFRQLVARGLQVRSDLNINLSGHGNINLTREKQVTINLENGHIAGNCHIKGVTQLSDLDLSKSNIDLDLSFSNVNWTKAPNSVLDLEHAHVSTIRSKEWVWPTQIKMQGLTYTHIPSRTPDGTSSPDIILNWLHLGNDASDQYTELAALFAARGERANAERFQFEARTQEMESLCNQGKTGNCILLRALSWIGFGIGGYTWIVLIPLLVLCIIGTLMVLTVPKLTVPNAREPVSEAFWNAVGIARNIRSYSEFRRISKELWEVSKGVTWAALASLVKILPFCQLHKSFTEFFENEEDFRLCHKVMFTFLALLGSILSLFLAAAVAGLTQHG